MRNIRLLGAAIALFSFAASGLQAATVFSTGGPDFNDAREITEFVQGSNFSLGAATSLDALQFWAAHPDNGCPSSGPVQCSFEVSVYEATTGGDPGLLLAAAQVTPTARMALGVQFGDYGVTAYTVAIPTLVLQPGTYWISLHFGPLSNAAPGEFFWMTAAAQTGLKTVEGQIVGGTNIVWGTPQDGALAFALISNDATPTPEPGTNLLILSAGAAGLLWRLRNWKLPQSFRKHMPSTFLMAVALATQLKGQTAVVPGTATIDQPTYTTLGVQLPVTGDTNYNATVALRYRVSGSGSWSSALPLFRVRPETIQNWTVPTQFAGSIFDLRPGVSYDVELRISDPDAGGLVTQTITGSTRSLPVTQPANPRIVNVTNSAELASAMGNAQAGDVITLQDGVYSGEFWTFRSGTAANPIVIRGVNADKAIVDGNNCDCIAFGIGSAGYVHVENLTMRNVSRAIRFTGAGSSNFVVRRIRTFNVLSAVYSTAVTGGVTVSDNVFHGPSAWPQVYRDDPSWASMKDAVALSGSGNVVAHNRFFGFADSIKFLTKGHRGQDIYGNDFYDGYDNAVELDGGERNLRVYRNRMTNTFMPVSFQPILGGPAYVLRNEMFNVVHEPLKFHPTFGPYSQTSGTLAYHNTSVNADYAALGIETPDQTNNFEIKNNIFFGPAGKPALTWGTPVYLGVFDYNAYFPDGLFWWKDQTGTSFSYPNLGALQASSQNMERNGRIVSSSTTFARGESALSNYHVRQSPQMLSLAGSSGAIDRALLLPNVNDSFLGNGPDQGAQEAGCAKPWYGPRPVGMDESNQRRGCEPQAPAVGTASFVQVDASTKGTWVNRYGSSGYKIAGDASSNSIAAVNITGNLEIWQSPSSSIKALRRAAPSTGRVAAGWATFQDQYVDVTILDGSSRQVALYLLDWGTAPSRKVEVSVLDANNRVLDTRLVEDLSGGSYWIWNVSGSVRFRLTQHLGAASSVVSGIFLDPVR